MKKSMNAALDPCHPCDPWLGALVANLTIGGNQFRGFFCTPPERMRGLRLLHFGGYIFGEPGTKRRITRLDFYGTESYEDHR